jgi:uncharacterized protein
VHVHVQPRTGRTEVVGRHGDALKIRVQEPPVDGRATSAAAAALARLLDVPARRVVLESGASSRMKRYRVVDMAAADVVARLAVAGVQL